MVWMRGVRLLAQVDRYYAVGFISFSSQNDFYLDFYFHFDLLRMN